MPITMRIITTFLLLRERAADAVRQVRDDERGELTAGVIFLAALAIAAVAIAALIVSRINSNADKIPG
jgi:hypothetical protein